MADLAIAAATVRLVARWPGSDIEIGMKLLSATERAQATAVATQAIRERGLDAWSTEAVTEHCAHMLLRVLHEPGLDGARLFDSVAELADVATDDEILALWSDYVRHRKAIDPDLDDLEDDELSKLIATLRRRARSDEIARIRVGYAIELRAYYGRPARELTAREVFEFGVMRGELVGRATAATRAPGSTLVGRYTGPRRSAQDKGLAPRTVK